MTDNVCLMAQSLRDNIPRLHRVVAHVGDQLRGIAQGAGTFEDCRVRYGETQQRLVREGRGRVTASREGIREDERNWSPTKQCLAELIRLGAIKDSPLPSSRAFLDRYRYQQYELTELGRELAELVGDRTAAFVDRLTAELIAAHPYLRGLILCLDRAPIVCPAVSEGDIERGRRDHLGTHGWGQWGATLIGEGTDTGAVAREIETHLHRRFGNPPVERPTDKALQEATNDALMVAGFAARGLQIDATSIKTLLRWGSELLLFDQSRYVPAFPECNVIWLAADLNRDHGGDKLCPARRGLAEHGSRVARALARAYESQAESSESSLAAPYLPIHEVRAQAAFETGVTRALADLVLAGMADGMYPDVGVAVLLHIGTSQLPPSEPAFRHHGRRRLEVTMSTAVPKEAS